MEDTMLYLTKKAISNVIKSSGYSDSQVMRTIEDLAKSNWKTYNLSVKQKKIYRLLMEELDRTIDGSFNE